MHEINVVTILDPLEQGMVCYSMESVPADVGTGNLRWQLGDASGEKPQAVVRRRDEEGAPDAFERAVRFVNAHRELSVSQEQQLRLYALFKTVRCGRCDTSRPWPWDIVGRAKW